MPVYTCSQDDCSTMMDGRMSILSRLSHQRESPVGIVNSRVCRWHLSNLLPRFWANEIVHTLGGFMHHVSLIPRAVRLRLMSVDRQIADVRRFTLALEKRIGHLEDVVLMPTDDD